MNGALTEDQTQDLKYDLRRADFSSTAPAQIQLQNVPLEPKATKTTNPISTNADGVDVTSRVFGDNPKVVSILHYNHGFNPDDKVQIQGVADDIGGIPASELNGLHTVLNSDFHTFTIEVATSATSTTVGGGDTLDDYQLPSRFPTL